MSSTSSFDSGNKRYLGIGAAILLALILAGRLAALFMGAPDTDEFGILLQPDFNAALNDDIAVNPPLWNCLGLMAVKPAGIEAARILPFALFCAFLLFLYSKFGRKKDMFFFLILSIALLPIGYQMFTYFRSYMLFLLIYSLIVFNIDDENHFMRNIILLIVLAYTHYQAYFCLPALLYYLYANNPARKWAFGLPALAAGLLPTLFFISVGVGRKTSDMGRYGVSFTAPLILLVFCAFLSWLALRFSPDEERGEVKMHAVFCVYLPAVLTLAVMFIPLRGQNLLIVLPHLYVLSAHILKKVCSRPVVRTAVAAVAIIAIVLETGMAAAGYAANEKLKRALTGAEIKSVFLFDNSELATFLFSMGWLDEADFAKVYRIIERGERNEYYHDDVKVVVGRLRGSPDEEIGDGAYTFIVLDRSGLHPPDLKDRGYELLDFGFFSRYFVYKRIE